MGSTTVLDLDVMSKSLLALLKLLKYSDESPNVIYKSPLSVIAPVDPVIPISSGSSWLKTTANLVSSW